MKPNILFLVIDSLRADKFYGKNKTSITPYIDQIISQGVYFKNNVSTADGTVFGLSSIFTGLYPFKTGVTKGRYNKLDSSIENYFSILLSKGYHAYGCVHKIVESMGLLKDFEKDYPNTYDGFLNLSEGLGDRILNQLKPNSMKEPWIFFLHVNDIHFPIVPPNEFDNEQFGLSKYERMISSIDSWIGKILEKIDLKKTLVVITADHGQYIPNVQLDDKSLTLEPDGSLQRTTTRLGNKIPSFLEPLKKKSFFAVENIRKHRKEKKVEKLGLRPFEKRALLAQRSDKDHFLFDEKICVPLLFLGYGIKTPKIISQQVRSIDVFPTICDLLSFSKRYDIIDGQSLFPLFNEQKINELPIFLETSPLIQIKSNDTIGIRTSHYKYFRDKDDKEKLQNLYDLTIDPYEENNIIDENPEVVKEMEEIISKLRTNSKFDGEFDDEEFDDKELDEIEKELKKLGYN